MTALWPGLGGPAIDYISNPPNEEFAGKLPRKISILGSTGSIGSNALAVIEQAPEKLRVTALGAGRNIELLASQAAMHRPPWLGVATCELAEALAGLLPAGYKPQILSGQAGYAKLASLNDADCVLSAQAGSAGLAATLAAALAGKVIALANKESLVIAGGLLRKLCRSKGAAILPVDSEHQALFQCVAGRGQEISQLILTASGGPFMDWPAEKMAACRAEQALKHPTWKMGAKITIDSATLMNKGLEFIEAMHLYGINPQNIRILIHPQSIVHSLARMNDNSLLAQLAVPNMRLAIASCLLWPQVEQSFVAPLDLAASPPLQFFKPDLTRFPCLALALAAAKSEPGMEWAEAGLNPACIALNAANEAIVTDFLANKFPFGEIAPRIEAALLAVDDEPFFPPASHENAIWQKALNFAAMLEPLIQKAKNSATSRLLYGK